MSLIQDRKWDVIIVGTGMGGAVAGLELVRSGLSVLFIEKGGVINERIADPITQDERLAAGWWPRPMSRKHPSGKIDQFFAPLGCGLGGSTIHYAAALERMQESDFDELLTQWGRVPTWPISFKEFLSYYDKAELLFGLRKMASPDSSRYISDWDKGLIKHMKAKGLDAELLRVAIRYGSECEECIGKLCLKGCKYDAKVACIDEATKHPNCAILDQAEVEQIVSDQNRVQEVRFRRGNELLKARSEVVVLAAGAMQTPLILLRSANHFHIGGLANSSGLVGRNLMFHTVDLFGVWAPTKLSRDAIQKKALSIREFYVKGGKRLGYVQSLGIDAGRGQIAVVIKGRLRNLGLSNEFLLSLLAFVPSIVAHMVLGNAAIFVGMTEDDPSPENRVNLDSTQPDGSIFSYMETSDLISRANCLYESTKQAMKPWKVLRLSRELKMNFGHPCGTCRFGNDPRQSVLDPNCRTHDIENLYVVDSSFFPRSSAVNPSLTIAANALRVAEKIAERLKARLT